MPCKRPCKRGERYAKRVRLSSDCWSRGDIVEICACMGARSDNLRLSVRCKEPEGATTSKTKSCFRPYVEMVREEMQRTGEAPRVLVYTHNKKQTESLRNDLFRIFNEDDERHPDRREITVRGGRAAPSLSC